MTKLSIFYYAFLALIFYPPVVSHGVTTPSGEIDCNRPDLSQKEIDKCNITHDLEKVNLPQLPSAQEREEIEAKTQAQKQRLRRIRQSVEDMFNATLISAASYDADLKQRTQWNNLFTQLKNIVFENYTTEVHYVNIEDSKQNEIDIINNKHDYKFKYQDNNQVISVVVFKPQKLAHQADHATPLGVYNHGGQPSNYFQPYQSNVMLFAFADLGYAIACPNYRGGSPENHEKDMAAVVKHFRGLDYIDPNKIVLAGISAGTTLNARILDKPVMKEFAGLFLHTGLYNNTVFDALIQVPPKLPVFLASGRLDELVDLNTTLKYIRAFEDISHDFNYFIVENGGHQLIKKKRPGPLNVEFKSQDKYTRTNIAEIVQSIKKFYNSSEAMNYISYLVEFLDKIAYPELAEPVKTEKDTADKPIPGMLDLIRKVQVLQEFKSKHNKDKSFGPSLLSLNNTLKNAPYTFSQSDLKILLAHNYNADININIQKFLEKYDNEKASIRDEFNKKYNFESAQVWQKRVDEKTALNKDLHALVHEILKKEEDYKGSYVLYHGADSKAGFLYDVYSRIQRLLLIQPKRGDSQQNIIRLRALSDAFVKILSTDDLIQKMTRQEQKYPDVVFNYLPGYKDVGISAQWFLFGSYKYWFNATFFRYFREATTSDNISLKNILASFFSAIGITDKPMLDKIIEAYEKLYEEYIHDKNGILLQIFVAPEIIDEVAYVSETGGFPLSLKISEDSTPTHAPSKIMPKAVQDPMAFEAMLKENRSNFKHQAEKDRSEFSENKAGLAYVNSVEARFFMKPDYMDDPRKVQIINYNSLPYKKNGYDKALEERVAQDLALWLSLKPKLGPGMTHRMPEIVKLQKYIERERAPKRAAFTLYDLLSAGRFEQAKLWLKDHPEDKGAQIDDEGNPLLYQLLYDNKFKAAQWLVDHGASVNDTNKKKEPIILGFLDDNNMEAVEFLLKNNAEIKAEAMKKIDLLSVIRQKRAKTALWLIQNGADIDKRNTNNDTPLIFAAVNGLTDVAKALIDKKIETKGNLITYINQKNNSKLDALYLAVDRGHHDIAVMLLEAGANINTKDSAGFPVIYIALLRGDFEFANVLISKGANILLTGDHQNSNAQIIELLKKDNFKAAQFLTNASIENQIPLNIPETLKNKILENHLEEAKKEAIALTTNKGDINSELWDALFSSNWQSDAQKAIKGNPNRQVVEGDPNGVYKRLLYFLLDKDKYDQAQWLINNGADVNSLQVLNIGRLKDQEKYPILLDVLLWDQKFINESIRASDLLIKNGADVNASYLEEGVSKPILHKLLGLPNREKAIEYLIGKGADVNLSVHDNLPLLLERLLIWNPEYRERYGTILLKNGADVNAFFGKEGNKKPILYELLNKSEDEAAQWLIKKGANVNAQLESNKYPLLLEVLLNFKNNIKYADFLIKNNANVNATYEENGVAMPILHKLLLIPDNEKIIEYLISKGAHVNALIGENKYPLLLERILALIPEYRKRYGDILIKNGADVSTRTGFGESILAVLLKENKIEEAKYIILKGGKIFPDEMNLQTTNKMTIRELLTQSKDPALKDLLSLLAELERGDSKMALALITAGADIDAVDSVKNTPLITASREGLTDVVKALITRKIELKGDLKEYLDHKNSFGTNALEHAIIRKHQEPALALIDAGADVDYENPLILASSNNLGDVVKALIARKIALKGDIKGYLNRKNLKGYNALILAIDKGNHDIAMKLVEAGADINSKDPAGVPVIYDALFKEDLELAKLLISKGARLLVTADSKDSNALIIELLIKDKFKAAQFLTKEFIENHVPLNIPDTLENKILKGHMEDAKKEALVLTISKGDINNKLYNALLSDNWKIEAAKAIKGNPYRSMLIGDTNGVYKRVLYDLLEKDKYDQAQWFIDNGADVNSFQVINKDRLNAQEKFPILLDVLLWDQKFIDDSIRSSDLLIKNGADVNATYEENGVSKPILYKLIDLPNRDKALEYLMSKGADVNAKFGADQFPILLHVLLYFKDDVKIKYADLLIENGADVNARTGSGESILTVLLKNKKNEAARYLLEKGAKKD